MIVNGAGSSERINQVQTLALGLVVGQSWQLAAGGIRRAHCVSVKVFTEAHASTRSSQHYRRGFGFIPVRLSPCLIGCGQQHSRRPLHPAFFALPQTCFREVWGKVYLCGDFDPLPLNIKTCHWPNRNSTLAKTRQNSPPSLSKSCNYSRAGYYNTLREGFLVSRKQHSQFP
jgi:hypothetical protein